MLLFIPCTYAIIILTMDSIFKFESIILPHSIKFDKCLLGTGYHGATGNEKPKETSSLMSFFKI